MFEIFYSHNSLFQNTGHKLKIFSPLHGSSFVSFPTFLNFSTFYSYSQYNTFSLIISFFVHKSHFMSLFLITKNSQTLYQTALYLLFIMITVDSPFLSTFALCYNLQIRTIYLKRLKEYYDKNFKNDSRRL